MHSLGLHVALPTNKREAETGDQPQPEQRRRPTKKHKYEMAPPSTDVIPVQVAEHTTTGRRHIEDLLADEVLCHILQMLPQADLAVAARACRRWHACCPSAVIPKLSIRWAGSSLAAVQWACLQEGCPLDERICHSAAWNGRLEVLRWARENGCPWDECTCVFAAESGHLEVLQWARENGCPWDERTFSHAASAGHLEVLQWVALNGGVWDGQACAFAAKNGHLEVLQWAREVGCPWDQRTCSFAAMNGHLDVLKWAVENGCPWDKEHCTWLVLMHKEVTLKKKKKKMV
ncbi:Ankyrin repeat domain-containing protein [Balamuthia mandrillaris]